MAEVLSRESIYLLYYFEVMLQQVALYWIIGIVLGSVISVFLKDRIHGLFSSMQGKKLGIFGVIPASLLGIASPLCMYGTIPIAASFAKAGMREDWLAAFMMSSILLNPQLILYSVALGGKALAVRLISCVLCGILAGLLVRLRYRGKSFFNFEGFEEPKSHDTDPCLPVRLLKNIGRNIKATAGWFLFGIVLSAVFQRYVPPGAFASLFGDQRRFGVLMAATIGVPLYMCGGGTIPLLMGWLQDGMSLGSAAAFMITGPATKITNLSAVKIVLGLKHFIYYLLFSVLFAVVTGFVVDLFL